MIKCKINKFVDYYGLMQPRPQQLPQVPDGGGEGADLPGEAVAPVLQEFLPDALRVALHDDHVVLVAFGQVKARQFHV